MKLVAMIGLFLGVSTAAFAQGPYDTVKGMYRAAAKSDVKGIASRLRGDAWQELVYGSGYGALREEAQTMQLHLDAVLLSKRQRGNSIQFTRWLNYRIDVYGQVKGGEERELVRALGVECKHTRVPGDCSALDAYCAPGSESIDCAITSLNVESKN